MSYIRLSDLSQALGQSAEEYDQGAAALDAQAQAFESQAQAFAGRPEAAGFASQAQVFRTNAAQLRQKAAQARAESAATAKAVTEVTTALVTSGAQVGGAFLQADQQRRLEAAMRRAQQQGVPFDPRAFMAAPPQQPSGVSPGLVIGLAVGGLAIVGGLALVLSSRSRKD